MTTEKATFAAPSTLNLGLIFKAALGQSAVGLLDITLSLETDPNNDLKEVVQVTFNPEHVLFSFLLLWYVKSIPPGTFCAVFCHNLKQFNDAKSFMIGYPSTGLKILKASTFQGSSFLDNLGLLTSAESSLLSATGTAASVNLAAPANLLSNTLSSSPNMIPDILSPNSAIAFPDLTMAAGASALSIALSADRSVTGSPLFNNSFDPAGLILPTFNPSISRTLQQPEILHSDVKGDRESMFVAKAHVTANAIHSLAEQVKALTLKLLPETEAVRMIRKLDDAAAARAAANASPASTILDAAGLAALASPAAGGVNPSTSISLAIADIVAYSSPNLDNVPRTSSGYSIAATAGLSMVPPPRSFSPASSVGTETSGVAQSETSTQQTMVPAPTPAPRPVKTLALMADPAAPAPVIEPAPTTFAGRVVSSRTKQESLFVPSRGPPPIESLTVAQLEERLEKNLKMMEDGPFMSKLPDKGDKIRSNTERIRARLAQLGRPLPSTPSAPAPTAAEPTSPTPNPTPNAEQATADSVDALATDLEALRLPAEAGPARRRRPAARKAGRGAAKTAAPIDPETLRIVERVFDGDAARDADARPARDTSVEDAGPSTSPPPPGGLVLPPSVPPPPRPASGDTTAAASPALPAAVGTARRRESVASSTGSAATAGARGTGWKTKRPSKVGVITIEELMKLEEEKKEALRKIMAAEARARLEASAALASGDAVAALSAGFDRMAMQPPRKPKVTAKIVRRSTNIYSLIGRTEEDEEYWSESDLEI
ncbi:hypothetical protein HDU96_000390 [Phlyctochytrium bullatum]|nr:hypothetical protein HDU96_000390 [Phlyctochytrium bullatum]